MPEHRFAVGHVFIGNDASIWLSRWDMMHTIIVLNGASGIELANVQLPQDATPRSGSDATDGAVAWMVERDADGIIHLMKYRIERPRGDF